MGGASRPGVPPGVGVGLSRGLTYVAVVHPDAMAVVAGPALHDVVGVVRLGHLVVGVNDNLGESWSCLSPRHPAQGPAEAGAASRARGLGRGSVAALRSQRRAGQSRPGRQRASPGGVNAPAPQCDSHSPPKAAFGRGLPLPGALGGLSWGEAGVGAWGRHRTGCRGTEGGGACRDREGQGQVPWEVGEGPPCALETGHGRW